MRKLLPNEYGRRFGVPPEASRDANGGSAAYVRQVHIVEVDA